MTFLSHFFLTWHFTTKHHSTVSPIIAPYVHSWNAPVQGGSEPFPLTMPPGVGWLHSHPTPMCCPTTPPCTWNCSIKEWYERKGRWGDQGVHGLFYAAVPHHCGSPLCLSPSAAPSVCLWGGFKNLFSIREIHMHRSSPLVALMWELLICSRNLTGFPTLNIVTLAWC